MSNKKINLEIGYGTGGHLAFQAEQNPDEIFIGCEVFIQGTAKLLSEIQEKKLSNIFIYQDNAINLLNNLNNNILQKIFLLFPDPWPKTRHNKRRIIKKENIDLFAQKLATKGLLRIATDHRDYANWIIAQMINNKNFSWHCNNTRDWHKQPKDWQETKYQKKSLAGNIYYFFDFVNTFSNLHQTPLLV